MNREADLTDTHLWLITKPVGTKIREKCNQHEGLLERPKKGREVCIGVLDIYGSDGLRVWKSDERCGVEFNILSNTVPCVETLHWNLRMCDYLDSRRCVMYAR